MPAGDRTGPNGMGPMTGRGAGFCAGTNIPGFANARPRLGFGRGFGRGWGRGSGRGFRWRSMAAAPPAFAYEEPYYRPASKDEERRMLEEELREIEAEKQEIEKRLKEIGE